MNLTYSMLYYFEIGRRSFQSASFITIICCCVDSNLMATLAFKVDEMFKEWLTLGTLLTTVRFPQMNRDWKLDLLNPSLPVYPHHHTD